MLSTLPRIACAKTWPDKPIHITTAFPAGGGTDTMARKLAEKIRGPLGQPILVENRPGASGIIGTEYIARTAPDGYNVLLGIATTHASAPNYYKSLKYDPIRDFAPITLIGTSPFVLLVNAERPYSTVGELVAYAKKNPGMVSFASIGDGSPHRFAGELLQQAAGIQMIHVPFGGTAPATNDLMGGHVDIFFCDPYSTRAALETGKVRALACTSRERFSAMPDVPTFIELGYPIEHLAWYGLFVPAGTPRDVVERLNNEFVKAIRTPDFTALLEQLGFTPGPGTPEEFAAFVKSDNERWAKLIAAAGVERQ